MKRISLFFAMVIVAVGAMAQVVQEQPVPHANKNMRLERIGNTYIYDGQIMNSRQTLDWFAQQNCQAACERFVQGRKLAKTGWILLGIGGALDVGAWVSLGVLMLDPYASNNLKAPSRYQAASNNYVGRPAYTAFVLLGVSAAAFEIACIPTLIVGYNKMHSAADMYNILKAPEPQPYLALQSGPNGLGLALHF